MFTPSCLAGLPLLADLTDLVTDPEPTWTNKELLRLAGAALVILIPIGAALVRFAYKTGARRVTNLVVENEQLRTTLRTTEDDRDKGRQKLMEAETMESRLREDLTQTTDCLAVAEARVTDLATQVQGLLEALTNGSNELARLHRRLSKATERDGTIWTAKVLAGAPEFKQLDPEGRRTPIVSIVNLKGGVGKTTVAANLGAALHERGYRVLFVDLDLQGSLSALFLPEAQREQLARDEWLIEDFLSASSGTEFPDITKYTQPVLSDGRSGLVPASDFLAYAEMNLAIRWILRESNRDPRFLLRKELHLKRVTKSFDVVILDCPPILNISCVNALAASDYLLIPVMPSRQATARVPAFLRRLCDFRENINPALKLLGLLANRTHSGTLSRDEDNRLSALRDHCRDVAGESVRQCVTIIPRSKDIRDAEDNNRTLRNGDAAFEVFLDLAHEVAGELPMFCRPSDQAVPARETIA
jgi:cellulose biosynthesis protein BcsQ